MRKLTLILFASLFSCASFGQMEVGYNTTDIGGEFQYLKNGKFIGVHLAINAKLHHSIYGTLGYFFAGDPTASFYTNKNNGGLGLGLGYRYYTLLRPHGFFIGAKANLFIHEVGLVSEPSKTFNSLQFIPALETGYMILVNDMLFITPTASFGYRTNLKSELKSDDKKTVGAIGISIGIKI